MTSPRIDHNPNSCIACCCRYVVFPSPYFVVKGIEHSISSKEIWRYESSSSDCDGLSVATGCGPEHWGKLPDCLACTDTGTSTQTPVDIECKETRYKNFEFPVLEATDGGCIEWEQFANTAVYEASFSGICENMKATYNGVEYGFKQLHFHSPSEHTIDGRYAEAEVHFVHISDAGDILVIGVMLELDGPKNQFPTQNNAMLAMLWANGITPDTVQVENSLVPLNPYDELLGKRADGRKAFHYTGSLTTPPCTEEVTWFVMKKKRRISLYDLTNIRSIVAQKEGTVISDGGNNNRPIQPLHGRTVLRNFANYNEAE